jgi:hypothetical protein
LLPEPTVCDQAFVVVSTPLPALLLASCAMAADASGAIANSRTTVVNKNSFLQVFIFFLLKKLFQIFFLFTKLMIA